MLVLDPDSGTFVSSGLRPPRLDLDSDDELVERRVAGTVVTQLWAPIDYLTAPFAVDAPVDDWPSKAVVMAWVLDDKGEERELILDSGYDDQREEAHLDIFGEASETASEVPVSARLVILDDFPTETPRAIVDAVGKRQRARLAGIEKTASTLNDAIGQIVWLRLFGGEAVGGKLKGSDGRGEHVVLDKPKRLAPTVSDWPTDRIRFQSIAAAGIYEGRRIPKDLSSTGFSLFLEATNPPASTAPQLWSALCPSCRQVIRPHWRSDDCWSCRSGNVRDQYFDLPDERLLGLLASRAEWQGLTVAVEQVDGGRWRAAFQTPEGQLVQTSTLEPSPLFVDNVEKRIAMVELLEIAEGEGFYLNPELHGTVPEWHVLG